MSPRPYIDFNAPLRRPSHCTASTCPGTSAYHRETYGSRGWGFCFGEFPASVEPGLEHIGQLSHKYTFLGPSELHEWTYYSRKWGNERYLIRGIPYSPGAEIPPEVCAALDKEFPQGWEAHLQPCGAWNLFVPNWRGKYEGALARVGELEAGLQRAVAETELAQSDAAILGVTVLRQSARTPPEVEKAEALWGLLAVDKDAVLSALRRVIAHTTSTKGRLA